MKNCLDWRFVKWYYSCNAYQYSNPKYVLSGVHAFNNLCSILRSCPLLVWLTLIDVGFTINYKKVILVQFRNSSFFVLIWLLQWHWHKKVVYLPYYLDLFWPSRAFDIRNLMTLAKVLGCYWQIKIIDALYLCFVSEQIFWLGTLSLIGNQGHLAD